PKMKVNDLYRAKEVSNLLFIQCRKLVDTQITVLEKEAKLFSKHGILFKIVLSIIKVLKKFKYGINNKFWFTSTVEQQIDY
ncbi:MAG: hypothetical protein Q8773_02660, partial [Candidatus Phytoplasma australasiaticum]|nr:hypothetical protein [Candidatus Phytoplasma australasiaticum]MDV3167743.1 hypothetical protein [Candidatus Phytoplasma australasiaticum]